MTLSDDNSERLTELQHSRRPLPERLVPAMKEHLQILDTLQAGNPEAAMQAVRHHLAQTLRWWGAVDA
jgi:DNA-binding FadR family transcriptional regulator